MCESEPSYIGIAEAARLLETTEMRILMMIKKEQLTGNLVDGAWYIDRSSLGLCERPTAGDIVRPGCGGGCSGRCGGT